MEQQNAKFTMLSFDIESCTGSQKDGSMCSFGYYLVDQDFNVIEHNDIIINPMPKNFKLGAKGKEPYIKLAYSEQTFRSAPKFNGVYEKIKSLFARADYAVGFAIINDVGYLNDACEKYGLEKIEYKFVDVQMLIKKHFKQKTPIGLKTMCERLEIDYIEHRSDEDARVTLFCLQKLCQLYRNNLLQLTQNLGFRLGVNNKYITENMQDGKKKNKNNKKLNNNNQNK